MKRLVDRSVGGGRYRLGVCRGRATMHPRVALCRCTRHETRGAGGEARRDARHRRAQEFYEGRVVGERGSRNKTSEEREREGGRARDGEQERARKKERRQGRKETLRARSKRGGRVRVVCPLFFHLSGPTLLRGKKKRKKKE